MNDIDVWAYALRLKTPWKTGWTNVRMREGFIVQIGRSHGDAAALPGAPRTELKRIQAELRRPTTRGPRQPRGPARNALLQAGLAEQAREAGLSLGSFLGEPSGRTPRRTVRANATVPILPIGKTTERATRLVRDGYDTLKLKLGPAASEWKRVQAVRDAIGPRVQLRLDPNGSWRRSNLASRLEQLEPFNIQYVEQPFLPRRPSAFLAAASRSAIPLAPDETSRDLAAVRALLHDGILEFVVLKPMVLGGPDVALEALLLVEESGATPIITDVVESGVGRAGALHVASLTHDPSAAHGLASGLQLRDDLLEPSLVPKRGVLRAPARAGLGVDLRRTRR